MTQLEAAKLRQLYETERLSIAAVARRLGVRKQTARAALVAAGIPIRRGGPRARVRPMVDAETQARISQYVRQYGMGRTARLLGRSSLEVHALLGTAPLPRRRPRIADEQALWAARQEGATIAALAVAYGCSQRAIYKALQRAFLYGAAVEEEPRGDR